MTTGDQKKVEIEDFKVEGFRKRSWTFLVLLSILYALDGGFILLLIIPFSTPFTMEVLLIVMILPFFFMLLQGFAFFFVSTSRMAHNRLTRWALISFMRLIYRGKKFLSIVPGVNLDGQWFMECNAREYRLRSINDLWNFFMENAVAFTLINAAASAVVLRTLVFLKGGIAPNAESVIDMAGNVGFFFIFSIPPFILAIYFVMAWTFRDAKVKVITPGKNEVVTVHGSIHNMMLLLVGFSSLTWLAEKSQEIDPTSGMGGIIGAISFLVMFFFLMGGTAIYMGVMYYRSGAHEGLVNHIRQYIRDNQGNPDFPVRIGMIRFEPMRG